MTRKVQWNNDAQPIGSTLDQILYQIRCADAGEGLLMDAVTPEEITEDSDGILTFDALVSPYARLERKMELLRGIMERAGDKVKPVAMQITEPFKQRGVAHVAVIFELSDGQTVSIYFHNPDGSPGKMAPTDEVISWKWLLNKKDITIVVAPERGSNLNVREVARRIMRLSEKNSAAFQRVNSKRAERMQAIQGLKDEIAGLEVELTKAQRELEVARVEAERAAAEAARTGVFFHSGLKIYPVTLNVGGDVKSMWAVQTLNNAEREANGERQLGGDPVSETIDGAKRLAEGEVASAKQLEEYLAAMAAMEAERAAAEAARKEANQGKTLSEIKAQKYLDAPVVDGETGERMTRAEWVKRRIEAGDALDTWLENKIKDKSRREWDRMDNQEQAAHEAKVREGGQVSKYRIGEYTVTKTEYDYAQKLLAEKQAAAVELTGNELGEFPDTEEGLIALRDAAISFYERNLINSDGVYNADLGANVLFDKTGAKKVKSLSADPVKLKMIPKLKEIIGLGQKTLEMEPSEKAARRGVVKAFVLKKSVKIGEREVVARLIVHLRRDGTFSYDHAVDRSEASKGVGRSSGAMDSVDATDHSQPVLHRSEPSFRHALGPIVGNERRDINLALDAAAGGGMVFNLFIEGEEPEEVGEEDYEQNPTQAQQTPAAEATENVAEVQPEQAAKPIAPADPRKLPFEWIEHQRAPAMRLEGSKSGFVAVPARGNRDAGTWNIVNTATGEVVRKIQKPKFARSDAERDLVSREEAARYGAGGYYAALQQYDKDLKAFEEAETAKLWANAPAIADVAAELQKIKGWDVSQSKRHEDEGALWIGNYANSRADTELMQDITREIWLNGNPIPKELASASAADVAAWIHVQEAVFAGDEEAAIDELADRYDPDTGEVATSDDDSDFERQIAGMPKGFIRSAMLVESFTEALGGEAIFGDFNHTASAGLFDSSVQQLPFGICAQIGDGVGNLKGRADIGANGDVLILAGATGLTPITLPGGEKAAASSKDGAILAMLKAAIGSPSEPQPQPNPRPEPEPQPESTTASTEYRYALVYRPAGPGAVPKDGFLRVDPAEPAIASIARHGVAVYSRELTEQELKSFELRRVHTESERAAAVEAIAQHFADHEYAANYYEYVQEGDAAMLEMVMRQEIEQQYPFDAFANTEAMPKEAGARFAELMRAKQPPAVDANPERTKAVQYLQGIVDGTTDPLTVDFDNLEALHANYGSDPEVAALFEKAADVVANAALAATA